MRASRTHSALSLAGLVALAAVLGGCRPQVPPGGTPKIEEGKPGENPKAFASQGRADRNVDVGPALYKAAEFPKFDEPSATGADPIVIPNCSVMYEDRQIVSAEVDGTIDLIATQMMQRADGVYEYKLSDGTLVTHDPRAFDPNKLHQRIDFIPREKVALKDNPERWVPYYKLRDGDYVASGQLLCMLDSSVYQARKEAAKQSAAAAKEGMEAAKEGVSLTRKKMDLYKGKESVVAPVEILNDQITLTRFNENLAQSAQTIAKAQAEYEEASVMLNKHWVKSRVTGFIRSVAKRSGDYVRAGEKLFEIQSTETIRLEGATDAGNYDILKQKLNKLVAVEPAVPSGPVKSQWSHQREVTGVAVTGHATRPLIVSVSLDGKAQVWDPNLGNVKGQVLSQSLPHPVPVRCVACTPPGGAVLAVTGADDGKVRVWNLADPAKLSKTPAQEPADFHTSAVTAVAVSPDGKYAATAAGREVFVWDLSTGKKLYSLPPEHSDSVTSVSFTPQAQLVTASRDRTLKVWKLGATRVALADTIENRAGVVDSLAVSPDGGRVLFDQDKGRIDLVNLADGQVVGQLMNSGPSTSFATLAAFAPDHGGAKEPYRIVTTGGEGDLKGTLQVWQVAKEGGRGAEIARLVTPGRAAIACAAFSPHKGENVQFLVVGTDKGTIHVWTPPKGLAKAHEGRITHIDATDPRYVTVRVEMSNPGVLDKSAATVIVYPGQ